MRQLFLNVLTIKCLPKFEIETLDHLQQKAGKPLEFLFVLSAVAILKSAEPSDEVIL